MSRRKVLLTTTIEAEQCEQLKALSARTRVPQAVYVREALRILLAQHDAQPGEWTGGFGVANDNGSEGANQ